MTTLIKPAATSEEGATPLVLESQADPSADEDGEIFLIIAPLTPTLGSDLLEAPVPCRGWGLCE